DFLQPALNPVKRVLACSASSGVITPRIVVKDLDAASAPTIIAKRATGEAVDPAELIAPKPISWRDAEGADVHGLPYATKREGVTGLPPAIIRVHGGPTAQARAQY